LFAVWLPHIHTCISQRDVLHRVFDQEQKHKDGGTLLTQMDFSESAKHERNNGPTAEKAAASSLLITENSFYCRQRGTMITETGAAISPDQSKDAAQTHQMLRHLWTRYTNLGHTFKFWFIISDGGPCHFKNKDALSMASDLRKFCGVPVTINFHQSHHGKSTYDPEGGLIKNAAKKHNTYDRFQHDHVKNSLLFYNFCMNHQELQLPKPKAQGYRSHVADYYESDDARFHVSLRWFVYFESIDRADHERTTAEHSTKFSTRGTNTKDEIYCYCPDEVLGDAYDPKTLGPASGKWRHFSCGCRECLSGGQCQESQPYETTIVTTMGSLALCRAWLEAKADGLPEPKSADHKQRDLWRHQGTRLFRHKTQPLTAKWVRETLVKAGVKCDSLKFDWKAWLDTVVGDRKWDAGAVITWSDRVGLVEEAERQGRKLTMANVTRHLKDRGFSTPHKPRQARLRP
jgi:hypothetical protein